MSSSVTSRADKCPWCSMTSAATMPARRPWRPSTGTTRRWDNQALRLGPWPRSGKTRSQSRRGERRARARSLRLGTRNPADHRQFEAARVDVRHRRRQRRRRLWRACHPADALPGRCPDTNRVVLRTGTSRFAGLSTHRASIEFYVDPKENRFATTVSTATWLAGSTTLSSPPAMFEPQRVGDGGPGATRQACGTGTASWHPPRTPRSRPACPHSVHATRR